MKSTTAILTVLAVTAAMVCAQDFDKPERPEKPDGEGQGSAMRQHMKGHMKGGRGGGEQRPEGRGKEGGGHERGEMFERLLSNPDIQEKLGLSEEDVTKIKEELYEMKIEMIDIKAQMDKIGLEQAKKMTEEELDEGGIMDLVEKAGELRTKMGKLQMKKMILMRKNIDPEKMKAVRSQIRERMKNRGEGQRPEGEERMGRGEEREGRGEGERKQKFEEMRKRRQQASEEESI